MGHVPVKPCLRSLRPQLVALRRLLTEVCRHACLPGLVLCLCLQPDSVPAGGGPQRESGRGVLCEDGAMCLCLPVCRALCNPALQLLVRLSGGILAC